MLLCSIIELLSLDGILDCERFFPVGIEGNLRRFLRQYGGKGFEVYMRNAYLFISVTPEMEFQFP